MTIIKTLLVLILLLVYPVVHAGEDKTGIPFRVAALEEITFLQQDQIDALLTDARWVIVAHPEGAPEIVMGRLISFTNNTRWVVVEADIAGESLLLWVNSNQFIRSNSTLLFPDLDCLGQAHASIPNQWYKQIHVVTDLGDSVVPYKPIGDQVDGPPWKSRIIWEQGPGGICENGDFFDLAAQVEPLADDLYVLYPRAPEPWSLEER